MKILVVLTGLFIVSTATNYACTIKRIPYGYWEPSYKYKFAPGEEVTIKCNPGWEVYGDPVSKCFSYGWYPKLARCIKKVIIPKCPKRGAPDYGYVYPVEEYYSPGDVIKFGCDKGYYLAGEEKDVCQKDGTWKINKKVYCLRYCGPRKPPSKGYVNPVNNYYKPGTVITFGCDKGYYLDGDEKDVCLKDGSWKIDDTPSCKPFCYPRKPPVYGSVYPVKKYYPVGSGITFSCKPGYYIYGRKDDKCVGSNKWFYNVDPKCLPLCPPRKPPTNGGVFPVKIYYKPKDIITFSCKPGYDLDGTGKDVCLPNGKWKVNNTPKCVKYCYITKVRPYIYYTPKEKYYEAGDNVKFACQKDYYLVGIEKFKCLDDGTWYPKTPFPGCVRRCYPPEVDNGGVINPKPYYNAGEWIKYYCDKGYTSYIRNGQCMKDGEWSQIATCKPVQKKCKGHKIKYGVVDPGKDWYGAGSTVEYSCNSGYTLDGAAENKCLSDGSWKYKFPICKKNPRKDTCDGRCNEAPDYYYTCQCDRWCRYKRNCCPDYIRTCTIYTPLYAG